MDPCALFEGNDDVVTFFIDTDLEGGEVEMRVPKIFLEDRHDHQDGARHGSQLFRVMIDNFLPVTRRQTSEFNKARTWEPGYQRYLQFLVGDYVDLEKAAEFSLKWMSPTRVLRPVSDFNTEPYEYGLTRVIPLELPALEDVYFSHSESGELDTMVRCKADGTVRYPGCRQFFRSSGMDVRLSFRKPYLAE